MGEVNGVDRAGWVKTSMKPMAAVLTGAVAALSGCLPVVQRPDIEPGFHLDGGVSFLADQPRERSEQGHDYMAYAAPSWGINERVEVGLPLGVYLEEGWSSLESDRIQGEYEPLVLPYLKLGLLDPGRSDRLALSLQFAGILPAVLGLQYGRNAGEWRPWVGVSAAASPGPAGDDPFITRFQQKDQRVLLLTGGIAHASPHSPALEVGVMRNAFEEGAVYGDFGQVTVPRTLYDLYMGLRFRLGLHRD